MKGMLEYIGDAISEENDSTRSKVLRILKICIMKFGMSNTELLLSPIREVEFELFNYELGIVE